jgi:hypothetical protein
VVPRVSVLVVLQRLHVVGSAPIVVEGVQGQSDMSIVLQVSDGDGDELLFAGHLIFKKLSGEGRGGMVVNEW